MDFKTAARLGGLLAKDYAEDLFVLLVNYKDISASEAASRLGLHIRTVQDFLEALSELDILERQEVYEKKRPYFRYTLKASRITLELNLNEIKKEQVPGELGRMIREKANAGANFALARNGSAISYITLWTGEGRDRKERRISLTDPQGQFMYHLPFPNAAFLSIMEIMRKAEVEETFTPEILDIVDVLETQGVIEEFITHHSS